jgi:hypothetical protein
VADRARSSSQLVPSPPDAEAQRTKLVMGFLIKERLPTRSTAGGRRSSTALGQPSRGEPLLVPAHCEHHQARGDQSNSPDKGLPWGA